MLTRFGYEKRSDKNTTEIKRSLSNTGFAVDQPLVRYGENREISTEDWVYLSIAKVSAKRIAKDTQSPRGGIQADGLTALPV